MFGYKTCWLSIKSESPDDVIAKSNFKLVCEANWASGLAYIDNCNHSQIFVSPCIDGFIFVIGFNLMQLLQSDRLQHIAESFEEVYCFSTHRFTEFHCWIKYIGGKQVRAYCYSGDEGEVLMNKGAMTDQEIALGFE